MVSKSETFDNPRAHLDNQGFKDSTFDNPAYFGCQGVNAIAGKLAIASPAVTFLKLKLDAYTGVLGLKQPPLSKHFHLVRVNF
jgi:hypothetical protein